MSGWKIIWNDFWQWHCPYPFIKGPVATLWLCTLYQILFKTILSIDMPIIIYSMFMDN